MNSRRGFIRSTVTSFLLGPSMLKRDARIKNGKPDTKYERAQAVAKLLLEPIERLEKHKMVFTTEGGNYFRGPKLNKVHIKEDVIHFETEG